MNFFKRRAALTALGAAALATVAGSAMAQTVTLRLHQMLPPQATIPAKALVPWAQKIEAESGGKIKVQLFHAMQLGGAPPSGRRTWEQQGRAGAPFVIFPAAVRSR